MNSRHDSSRPLCRPSDDAASQEAREKRASDELALSSVAFLGGAIAALKESSERAYARAANVSRSAFDKGQNWVATIVLGAIGVAALFEAQRSRRQARAAASDATKPFAPPPSSESLAAGSAADAGQVVVGDARFAERLTERRREQDSADRVEQIRGPRGIG